MHLYNYCLLETLQKPAHWDHPTIMIKLKQRKILSIWEECPKKGWRFRRAKGLASEPKRSSFGFEIFSSSCVVSQPRSCGLCISIRFTSQQPLPGVRRKLTWAYQNIIIAPVRHFIELPSRHFVEQMTPWRYHHHHHHHHHHHQNCHHRHHRQRH
jgi:hypothetical protein